ncbi:MAG TPA: hypothetical protein VFN22_11025 [Gemmatimonadales bacterium]|nr:hypothetical protein [Gemmatimonadales bacterium]
MHIELTDLLRCPADHEESFLVLLPDRMEGRRVLAGHLGCPVCNWSTAWDDGIPVFGEVEPSDGRPPVDADDVLTMLGIEGPGGWLVFEGHTGVLAEELRTRLPDVRCVVVNPPPGVTTSDTVSVLRSPVWPIKRHSARGVVLGPPSSIDRTAALRSALPGLRIVGEGMPPALDATQELLATIDDLWVVLQH